MLWLISAVLAIPVALLHMAGLPLIWAVVIPTAVLVAVAATRRNAVAAVTSAAVVTLVLAAVVAVVHGGSPAVRGPAAVTFGDGTYSSYGAPSFTVDATNDGGSPGPVHSIRVRFVNDRTAQVITEVTEPVSVTVPAGQSRALTYAAPQAVAGPDGPAVTDRDVSVTVTGWQ